VAQLLEFCGIVGVLLIDAQPISMIPGLLMIDCYWELRVRLARWKWPCREGAQSALMQMAQRGDLVRRVAIEYIKRIDGRIEKDPDARVGAVIDLICRKFAELGSVRQAYFWLHQQQIQLPILRGPEDGQELIWQAARYHAVRSVLKNPIYAGAYAYGRSRTVRRLEVGRSESYVTSISGIGASP
jgi:hypothetical protein